MKLTASTFAKVGTFALAAALTACAERAPDVRTTPIEPELAIATFDSAWSIVHRTHFDPEFEGVDWMAVREELRPRAEITASLEDLRALLQDMIGRIGLSHFALIEEDAVDALRTDGETGDAEPGLSVRLVGDDVLVWKVRTGSAGDLAGVRPGWKLLRVGERDLVEAVTRAREHEEGKHLEIMIWSFAESLLRGREGSQVELVLLDGSDTERELTLERETAPGVLNQFGNLPPMRATTTHELVEYEGLRIGVIHFNIWLVPVMADFERALDLYRDADGLIIDLRGNIGGVGAMAMGMAGHLLDEKATLGVMRTRTTSLDFRVNPRITNAAGERIQPFGGPLAILQDPMSMSTSEIFAQGLQTLGRARVFGETSGGAALPSHLTRLPSGDVLQHAFADFVDPEGTRLEGRGVVPDESVPLTRADLLAGRDAPRAAALQWIADRNDRD